MEQQLLDYSDSHVSDVKHIWQASPYMSPHPHPTLSHSLILFHHFSISNLNNSTTGKSAVSALTVNSETLLLWLEANETAVTVEKNGRVFVEQSSF